jgi:tetratricopeptide (TPR) repeat protein
MRRRARRRAQFSAPLAIVAVLAASVGPAAAIPSEPQIQRATGYCLSGARALEAGNVRKAKASFAKAIAILPNYPEAHLGMGHIAMRERRFGDALHEYETAKEHFAEMSEALVAIRTQRFSEAQQEIVALMDALVARQRLAPVPWRINRLEAAIERLQAIEPPDGSARIEPPGQIHFYLGNALYRLSRLGEAVASWESCVSKAPGFSPAYNNLAVGYWMLGRIDDARHVLDRAEELGLLVNRELKADLDRAARIEPAQRG